MVVENDTYFCDCCSRTIDDSENFALVVEVQLPGRIKVPVEWDDDNPSFGYVCWGCATGEENYLLTGGLQTADVNLRLQTGFTFKRSEYLFVSLNEACDGVDIDQTQVEYKIGKWKFNDLGKWELTERVIPHSRLMDILERYA